MTVYAGPIGRAARFSACDYLAWLRTMGITMPETATIDELASRINRAVDRNYTDRALANLAILRRESGFDMAGRVNARGHVMSKPKSKQQETVYACR